MHPSQKPQVYAWLACVSFLFVAGCNNPSSQSLVSLSVTATPASLAVGGAAVLKATAHLSDGTTQDVSSGTVWTASDTTLASVANGALTAKAAGTVMVQAAYVEVTPAGSSPASTTTMPQSLSASTQVTITSPGSPTSLNVPTITWNTPAAITTDTALSGAQLNATASVPGTFTYTPASGTLLPAGSQTLSVVFTPTDKKTYSAATANVQLAVAQATSATPGTAVITWAAPATIAYGTALSNLQLNATANVAGVFTYSPAMGTVLHAGTQTLSATFTPAAADSSPVSAAVQLTVAQATPVITWPAPAAITVGVPLTATQLDATANVPGTLVYTPAAGNIPAVGTLTLTAAFSPTDATDYASTTAQNVLTVNSATMTPVPPPVTGLPVPAGCGGPTINLNPNMSQSTLQSTITNAASCSLIVFTAGTYNITAQLSIPCNDLQITGPVSATPAAILAASFQNGVIFAYPGGCTKAGSVNYLHFENTGGVYFGVGSNGNFTFQYNQVTHLPSNASNTGSEVGLFFDGSISTTLTNVVVEHNTFGDASSCTTVFATPVDEGGYCAGIIASQGTINGITVLYNNFVHVEEGIHFNQLASWAVGNKNSVCISCDIEYNFITNYHRIGIEIQVSTPTNSILIKHNSITDPVASSWGTFAVSMACCEWTAIMGTPGYSPGYVFDDNVLIASLPVGSGCPPYGVEFWGAGSQGTNSLVEGTFCNGYTYGYGGGSWAINNNNICGPNYHLGGYISNEEGETAPPTETGNTISGTCSTISSTTPTITPAGGSFSGSATVTLADSHANTGIWYTTDGSTPVPGSGSAQLYAAPFSVSRATTVKAVGMWGSPNQPLSYPAGYGYTPSGVVSASFVAGSVVRPPAPRLSASSAMPAAVASPTLRGLEVTPAAPELIIGGSAQLKALAMMSDGSTRDVTAEVVWQSSDLRTVLTFASGSVTALASGQAMLTASYLGQQAAVLATSAIGQLDWNGPLVITQGGTYTGNWQSTDAATPAVTIATTAPVILENAHLRGTGSLIKVAVEGVNLTVRNSLGVAVAAVQQGQANGVFLDAGSPAGLDVENNYMENVRNGVLLRGYVGSRGQNKTIVIRGNRARNLTGQLSDGRGGYLSGKGVAAMSSRFVELDNVQAVPGIDIGWNEVINYPMHSLVSDVIDLYRSSGTLNQPLEVHDSYIQGAYPAQPAVDAYLGGGIKTDGAVDDTEQNSSSFTYIHDNQVIGTVGYGIAFAAGHDNLAANNRVLSSGVLADGTRIAGQQAGLMIAPQHANDVSAYNNSMRDNLVGWACWTSACRQDGFRRDQYFPAAPGEYANNSAVSTKYISYEMEENEYQQWLSKTAVAGIRVGPSF